MNQGRGTKRGPRAAKQVPASLKDVLDLPVEAVQFMKSQPGVHVCFMSV